MTPSFKSPVRNNQPPPNSQLIFFFSEIMFDVDQTFRIDPIATTNFFFNVQLNQFLQVSIQEGSTFSKPPYNQIIRVYGRRLEGLDHI